VQLTIPYLFYSLAIRHVRALDAAIISIIEPILNPIWVMLATSEQPTFWSIVGGSIVLATSLTRSLLASRNASFLVLVLFLSIFPSLFTKHDRKIEHDWDTPAQVGGRSSASAGASRLAVPKAFPL
jgi:hypothetical protein